MGVIKLIGKLKKLDASILLLLFCFMIISTFVIYSATSVTNFKGLHVNNLVMFGVLFIPMIAFALIDYRIWVSPLAYVLYGLGIIFLLYVMWKGLTINGAKRWINLGFMQFQPSELVKIFVILVIARFLKKRNGNYLRLIQDIIPISIIVFIPFLFVFLQPDLGTSIVFACIFLGSLWIGNIRLSHALLGIISFAILVAMLTTLYFNDFKLFTKIIKPHQMERIQTFINPASDPNQSYHVLNSIKAVGAGQLFGEGFKKGYYIQNSYIPYDYADSIYVVIGEEFGFIGSAILLLLYFFLIYKMIIIAYNCNDLAGSYIIIGIVSMLVLQIFENIAMHTGIMPLTGIALPFISYGGSSLLTNMIAMGLVLNIKIHSEPNQYNI
jgi:rod shape determining protein RodA